MITSKIVDDKLEITETPAKNISTMSKQEIDGKIAEAQTKIDHLQADLVTAEAEKAAWVAKQTAVKAAVIPIL